jgi:hypothetical protein
MTSVTYAVAVGHPTLPAAQVVDGPEDMIGALFALEGQETAPHGRFLISIYDAPSGNAYVWADTTCAATFVVGTDGDHSFQGLITRIIDADTIEVAGAPVRRESVAEVLPPAYYVRKYMLTPNDFRDMAERYFLVAE